MPAIFETTMEADFLSGNDKLEEANSIDDADSDDTVVPEKYDITSFGADYDVEGLVRRLQRGDIFIPSFQRNYVWNQNLASRFIESLLLGLPIPGIFLAREAESNKLIVIDGQQRLRTLQFFYDGFFKPKQEDNVKKVFKLQKVQSQFEGCTHASLAERDRITLNDSIIHATIIKQISPEDNDTSLYHIFERLNSGGISLGPQEMRTAVYHGDLIDLVKSLNGDQHWRSIFGQENNRLKDQEFILRFLALYFYADQYKHPMGEFLTVFAKKYQRTNTAFLSEAERIFSQTIKLAHQSLNGKAFRPDKVLNAALFDAVMVGLARRIEKGGVTNPTAVKTAYDTLLLDDEFTDLISQHTSDDSNVKQRLQKATLAFSGV
jgi:uncharacterized protein with ParB-like and HNH nuclease domain